MSEMADYQIFKTAWCPGCGNFAILNAVKSVLVELKLKPSEVLLVGGIGQAAKLPQYLSTNGLCTLHGRALPGATGVKIANPELTVLVHSGDGDCYGEGGNHLIHGMRRNIDLTLIVHNNQTYGLTQGQASPTSDPEFRTGVQPRGVLSDPLRGPALALALGCGFVARSFSGDITHLKETITRGIKHRGFSFIEVLQPCVSMNKRNTLKWYKERAWYVESETSFSSGDWNAAMEIARTWGERIPLGVLFEKQTIPFEERLQVLSDGPLTGRPPRGSLEMEQLFDDFR